MNKILTTVARVLALLCALAAGQSFAGDALDAVNAEVENKAEQIDRDYGVLLTTTERNDLKVSLVAKKVAAALKDTTAEALAEQANKAIEVYEITDPTDQRKLLIEMDTEIQKSTGNIGVEPPR